MSLDRGRCGQSPERGVPTHHQKPGETNILDFVRHLKMITPGCSRVSVPYREVILTIAQPVPGVRGDPVLLTMMSLAVLACGSYGCESTCKPDTLSLRWSSGKDPPG